MSSTNLEDNYLSPEKYSGYTPDSDGFARFMHPDNGQWYFAYHQYGELILRSEGYLQESGRDNGIASVKKYKDDDANYRVNMQPDGLWVLELWAANNKEIARSSRFSSETEARRRLPSALAIRSQMAFTSRSDSAREDDYLTCKEYENQPRIPEHREFSLFEKGGEYYFSFMADQDEVLLRSEGYKSEDGRVNGMQSVLRNKGDRDRYRIEEKMGYYFVVLTAANRKEIARSCPKSESGALALLNLLLGIVPVAAPIVPIAAVAAAPLVAPLVTPAAAPVAPPVAPPVTERKSGFAWWWWLLLLLLLLLLFLLWKSCNKGDQMSGSTVTTQVDTQKVNTQTQPASVVDTPKVAPTSPTKVTSCDWSPVHFEYGRLEVVDTARSHIQRVVDVLKANSSYTATFVGNTDDKGSVEFNTALAKRRAEAVKTIAVQLGIDANRITIGENNEQKPVATNASEEGRSYNRRVVMFVYDVDKKLICKNLEDVVPEGLQTN